MDKSEKEPFVTNDYFTADWNLFPHFLSAGRMWKDEEKGFDFINTLQLWWAPAKGKVTDWAWL